MMASTSSFSSAAFWLAFLVAWITLFSDVFKHINLEAIAITIPVYVLVGVLWSLWKWYSLCVEKKNEIKKSYEEGSFAEKTTWEEFSKNRIPSLIYHHDDILSWMVFWPFSVVWWILSWPKKLFNKIYEAIKSLYSKIAESVFRG